MELDKKFIEKQKENLLKEQIHLEREIKRLKVYPDDGETVDDNDQEESDFENNQTLETQLETSLKKVKNALKLIEKGTYGKCKKCQNIIESDRLEIIPEADLCVKCSSKK